MNTWTGTGRLVTEPQIRTTKTGRQVCEITIAVERTKDVADFVPVTFWNETAESVYKFKHKGDLVGVTGALRIEKYQGDNGITRTRAYINAASCDFIQNAKREEPNEEQTEKQPEDLPF